MVCRQNNIGFGYHCAAVRDFSCAGTLEPRKGRQSACHRREPVDCGPYRVFPKPPQGGDTFIGAPRDAVAITQSVAPFRGLFESKTQLYTTGLRQWQADCCPLWGL